VGSGGQREDVSESGVTGIAPHLTRLFGTVTPEPDITLTLHPRRRNRRVAATRPEAGKRPLTQRGFARERRPRPDGRTECPVADGPIFAGNVSARPYPLDAGTARSVGEPVEVLVR
jgi:hypothetical protein